MNNQEVNELLNYVGFDLHSFGKSDDMAKMFGSDHHAKLISYVMLIEFIRTFDSNKSYEDSFEIYRNIIIQTMKNFQEKEKALIRVRKESEDFLEKVKNIITELGENDS